MEQVPFKKFGLSPELLSGLADLRIDEPTPLQNEVIPQAIQEQYLLVKNEAGDTGIFLIPAVHILTANGELSETKILILTPSVERIKLIDEAIWAMGYHAQISSASLSMKGNRGEQEQAMLAKAPVIVANPGRLTELLEKTNLTLDHLDLVILDDAQDMENHNLVKRVEDIFQKINASPKILISAKKENQATKELSKKLFNGEAVRIGFDAEAEHAEKSKSSEPESTATLGNEAEAEIKTDAKKQAVAISNNGTSGQEATSSEETEVAEISQEEKEEEFVLDLDAVTRKLEKTSIKVVLNPEQKAKEEEAKAERNGTEAEAAPVPADLSQAYIYVPPRAKISTLLAHLEKTLSDKIVVFAASKRTTDRLFRIIKKKGWGVVSIDEYVDESTNQERFDKFVTGEMKILLAGGIAAAKLELDEVKQVINYDVPSEVEEYKFRAELVGSGKAARMVSLVSKMDKADMDEIVGKVGYAPTEIPLPEEIKEKKKERAKSPRKEKPKYAKPSSPSPKQPKDKSRKKANEKSYGLPRPTYDGLSGGREGNSKRPTPQEGDGAFGWIKKLFN